MADIAKGGAESLCSPDPPPSDLVGGLVAGENYAACDLLCIHADGMLWRYTAASPGPPCGFAPAAGFANQPAAYTHGRQRYNYGPGTLTPGTPLYCSVVTPGALADAAPGSGFAREIAIVYDANCIQALI